MGYIAVKGGEKAIANAAKLLAYNRNKDQKTLVSIHQIQGQFRAALDRIMGEGGLYDPEYAAIAFKQAEGDPLESAFILRAFRASLKRSFHSLAIDTEGMQIERRISASFREIPGGQILGPTRDYSQRLLDLEFAREHSIQEDDFFKNMGVSFPGNKTDPQPMKKIIHILQEEGLLKKFNTFTEAITDITREAIRFPAPRSARLQMMARAETGGLMSLAYAAIRGFEGAHPTVGELRYGSAKVIIKDPSGRERYIGKIKVTEAEMITKMDSKGKKKQPLLSLGYGLCFGHNDTKAISMGILDRTMRDDKGNNPWEDEEFVLYHTDGIDAVGFINHLKLPHYVTFQSRLDNIRRAIKYASVEQHEEI